MFFYIYILTNPCKSMKTVLGILLSFLCTLSAMAQPAWQDLFNGKDLNGWTRRGGEAPYRVVNGEIIGTSVPATPNSFLCTATEYGDFVLELEVLVDPMLNSGIQFRSQSLPDYRSGQVHGYQAEVDPSPRAYSGGIYDEGRRGWICPLAENEAGRRAFKNGTWNQYRIEAMGSRIRVWVNGVLTANLVDDLTPKGFIALQVHSIDSPGLSGREVRWRNIRLLPSPTAASLWPLPVGAAEVNLIPNTLTEQEIRKGWRLLWDGRTTEGWRSARGDQFPEKGWRIHDGELTVEAGTGGESAGGGDLITHQQFASFELSLEFRIAEGANSGIKYFVQPDLNQGQGSAIGCEFQILDDQHHPDAAMGVGGNRTLGSLYDLIPAANLSVPGRSKDFRGTGAWNLARVVVRGNHVEHWLNGFKVVEYERNTPMFRALVAYSKYKVWPGFGDWPQGHILLQDHGNEVSFRSIKIREL
jgi:hypothetical protein